VIGRLRGELHLETEHGGKDVIEPQPRRRRAKYPVVFGKQAPDGAPIGGDGCGISGTDPQAFEKHSLAHQHAQQVVVRPKQQTDSVLEGFIA
jgi:hypothetical protein